MSTTSTSLAAALSDRCRLEREPGQGGMATGDLVALLERRADVRVAEVARK